MSAPGRRDFDVKQILRIRWRWFGHATSPPPLPPPGAVVRQQRQEEPVVADELLSRTAAQPHPQHHLFHPPPPPPHAPASSSQVSSSLFGNKFCSSASPPPPPPLPSPPPVQQEKCGSGAFTSPQHSRSAPDVTRELGGAAAVVVGACQGNGTAREDDENNNNCPNGNGGGSSNNNTAESETSSCRTSNSSATLSSCVSMEPCVPDELFQSHSHAEHTFKRMETYLRTRKLCDVVLVAGDRKIPAHRLVLSSVSDYFAAMFTSDVREAKQEEVKMEGVDPDALWVLVQYAYTGRLEMREDTIEALLSAACLLQLSAVVQACCSYLMKQLHPSNCLGIRSFADAQGCQDLHKVAHNYTMEHFLGVMKNQEFLLLPACEVEKLLVSDDMNVPDEETVVSALLSWVQYDAETRQTQLPALLQHVRLPLLKPQFLADMESNPLLRDSVECQRLVMEAMKYHLLPERRPLLQSPRTRPRKATVGALFAVGGMDATKGATSMEQYCVRRDTWRQVGVLSGRRLQFGVAVIDQRLYVVGGRDGLKTLNTVECYNPRSNTWSIMPPMATHRHGLGVAVLEGPMYAVGGHDGWSYLSTVERWDPQARQWSFVASMATPRSTVGVAVLNSKLYAVGGRDGSSCLKSVECFDPHTNKWSACAPMAKRRGGVGVATWNGFLYAIGGHDAPASSLASRLSDCVERYDPKTDTWTAVAPMSVSRDAVGVCLLGDRLYAVGGYDGQVYLNTVEAYDPQTNESKPLEWCRGLSATKCEKQLSSASTHVSNIRPDRGPRLLVNEQPNLSKLNRFMDCLRESRNEITFLQKHNEELTARVKNLVRAETELSHLTKRFCRGLQDATDFTSEFVEVAALGRRLDLGMLYDCRSDSFSSDAILWENGLISSLKLSIPRAQTDVKVLDGDSLHDRLTALDLTPPLRASVVSGLVETAGASAFINHQSQLQNRVTLCYRTSTRLDMLSHELLHGGFPLSVTGSTSATHVVVAVLYGSQAFSVFDSKKENGNLKDKVEKMINPVSQSDLLFRLSERDKSALNDHTTFVDGTVLKNPADGTAEKVVPLKVWLYPLKNLDQTSACIVKHISEEQLSKAENILEKLQQNISSCHRLMSCDGAHDVFMQVPALKNSLSEFSSLFQQHQDNFKKRLASCIKTLRETGAEEEEENLRDLLDRAARSPFSSPDTQQWLRNKSAEMRALLQCRSANVRVPNDLQHFVRDCRADRVLCFVLTSLDNVEDPLLSALRKNAGLMNKRGLGILDTSQKICSDFQSFLLHKESNENRQETVFVAASVPDSDFPGSTVHLYQSGSLLSLNVTLDVKPDPAEIITARQTRVTMKLQSAEGYRVEYRAVKEGTEWRDISHTGETCVVSGLRPETHYELRYALMDSKGMSDYSGITEFQTVSRVRPGAPTVLKLNKEEIYIAWQKAEEDDDDEDSRVLSYIVEYLEAGLEGWQSIRTDGPVCECTITLPDSTCYKARVCAVYANGDTSAPSEETKVPVRVWSIDLSKRKASVFLEVLRIQTAKKAVKLRDCPDEESEVRSFLQCLSHISQLSIDPPQTPRESLHEWRNKMTSFLTDLCLQAAVHEKESVQETVQKLPSCYLKTYREQSAFLLDLYSHVKSYEAQTGSDVRPALHAIYQTLPEVWSVNLSKRKASDLLEVLELQRTKKAVEVTGWTEEESEMRSLLQCLPFISELSFTPLQPQRERGQERRTRVKRFILDLCLQAALHQKDEIHTIVEKCFKTDKEASVFLLLLHSHFKQYETRTGRNVVSALQPVYQSLPKIWSINLSDKNSSLFVEVLELQGVKKAVELRGWSEDESEMRSLILCLPFISELRFGFTVNGKRRKIMTLHFLVKLMAGVAERSAETGKTFTEQLASLCSFRTFSGSGDDQELECNMLLELYSYAKDYESETGRSVLPVLQSVYQTLPEVWTVNLLDKNASLFLEVLELQTVKKAVELTGWSSGKIKARRLFQSLHHVSQLRLCSDVLVRIAQTKSLRSRPPVSLDELLLTDSGGQQPDRTPSKILSSFNFLLRRWNVQCLNLTESKMAARSLVDLLHHQGSLTIRFSEETLQELVSVVYEAQDEDLTLRFLRNVGGDLSSCVLSWDVIRSFLQCHPLTVDVRRSTIREEDIQDLLPVLDKVQLRGLKSSFVLSVMRKIYETSSAHSVSILLSSTENCVNLENRKLSSVDCAALRFTLEHCTGVSLKLLWSSVPEGELESIIPLLSHVSHLRVDRRLLLRLLHCCDVRELHQEAAVLLSALQHKLDFSSYDALDLTADTTSLYLSSEDCRVVSTAIHRAHTPVQVTLQDCEIEDRGVELLFPVLHTVSLRCSKALLLHLLDLVDVGTETERVWRAVALSRALSGEVDLSETRLNLQTCKSLALVLEYSEGLSELDLSHCQLTDQHVELLLPHLHKPRVIDLSHNLITDASARSLYHIVSVNSHIQTV
ncbi:kelch-like protein 5 isoform X1, partial [Clarias magur]